MELVAENASTESQAVRFRRRKMRILGVYFLVFFLVFGIPPAKSTFRYFHQRAFTSDWDGVTFRFGVPWVQGQFLNGFGNFFREKLPWQGNEQIPWPGYLFHNASTQLLPADSDFAVSKASSLARWRTQHDAGPGESKADWRSERVTYTEEHSSLGDFECANDEISARDGKAYVDMDCISLTGGWRFDYEGSTKYQDEALGILLGAK